MAVLSNREKILLRLTEAADGRVSGQALAQALGISRSAVWKLVGQLRQEGYEIEGGTNRGYTLLGEPDRVTEETIHRHLTTRELGRHLEVHEVLDSTNVRARQLANQGAPHGTLVVAESQTGGRGRRGRSFFSPPGTGLYLSFVLRPQLEAEQATMITSLAAVAVARAIERQESEPVRIKWVNDLYMEGKKICGILCEAGMSMETGLLDFVVLGIGINVQPMVFPPELQDIATSVGNVCGHPLHRSQLAAEVAGELETLWPDLAEGGFLEESRRRSNVLGRRVLILRGEERQEAEALAIDDMGRLVVRTAEGKQELNYGEVSLRWDQGEENK